MKHTIYVILFIAFLFTITKCQVISNEDSIFDPSAEYHDHPENGKFKISINLRDNAQANIYMYEEDNLFDNITCLFNETMEMHKYIALDARFECVYTCGFGTMGQSTIKVRFNDEILKQYTIGHPTGVLNLDSSYVDKYSSISVGYGAHFKFYAFDTYGNPIIIDENNEYYNKINCYTNVQPMEKIPASYGLKCLSVGDDDKKAGTYTATIEFLHDDNSIEILDTFNYTLISSSIWDPNLSTVSFPTLLRSYQIAKITITDPRDQYGNMNKNEILKIKEIRIVDANTGTKLYSQDISCNDDLEFYFVPPYTSYARNVKIKMCDVVGGCKDSNTIYFIS